MATRTTHTKSSARSSRRRRGAPPPASAGPTILAVASLVLVAGLLAGVVVWRLQTRPEPARYGLVLDRSNSYLLDCGQVAGIANAYLAKAPDVAGSRLFVVATSTKERDFEPALIFEQEIPYLPPSPLGHPERDIEQLRRQLVQQVQTACEALETADNSPIRRGVERAVQHLAARSGYGAKHLTVMTDLQERVDELDGALPPIQNPFEVVFCGSSNRGQLGITAKEMLNLEASWQAQFSGPVRFEPFCASSTPLTAAAP